MMQKFYKRYYQQSVDRISAYGELSTVEEESEFRFFRDRPTLLAEKILWKNGNKEDAVKHLTAVAELILYSDYSSPEVIKESIMPYAEEHGKGDVLWPLRMSLSGQEKSVDPFTICYVLGYDETKARIRAALLLLES
jgi:hypothetical protein